MDSLLSQTLTYYGERTYTHLSERAYDIIVEMIITLQLTPGEIYSENAFIEMTGIGRTPIREAIKRLESINMLQSFPRSGVRISNLRSEDVQLEREVRCAIEGLIIKKTAQNAFPHERQHLRKLMEEYDRAFQTQDYLLVVRSDLQFHLSVAAYARNSYAKNALLPFLISECRLFYLCINTPGTDISGFVPMHESHLRMMQCVIAGQGEEACTYLYKSTFTSGVAGAPLLQL